MRNRKVSPRNRIADSLSRRDFLKAAAATGAAGLLAGCKPIQTLVPTPSPTIAPIPTPTPILNVDRNEIIRFHPAAPSKVIRTHHAGVWSGVPQGGAEDNALLDPSSLREMLDSSIVRLTGLPDASSAWGTLFSPGERVAIKVNSYGGSTNGSRVFTHAALVSAVAQALQDARIPAEQIVIYDINTADLQAAGFSINRDGAGMRCHGTAADWAEQDGGGGDYVSGYTLMGTPIRFSRMLVECDALINMPVLKTHSMSGLTFAMKNHYGSFDRPGDFHWQGDRIFNAIPRLNGLPIIKDRTRLIIGDALVTSCVRGSSEWPDWNLVQQGDSIYMSFDPVAHDALGLAQACQVASENGEATTAESSQANFWLQYSAGTALGTNDPKKMEVIELNLR